MLLKYKYLALFAWVLAEQLGLPLPSAPVLMAAGALSAERRIGFLLSLVIGISASILADSFWFVVGRKYGSRVFNLVNKISLQPTNCVRSARESLAHRGGPFLLVAKFVPGVSLVAAPLAGQSEMEFGRFLLLDGLGSALWVGAFLAAGRYFGDLLKQTRILHWAGHFSVAVVILAVAAFLLNRVYRRRLVMRRLSALRVEPEELKKKLDAGESVYIVDLRHPLELLVDSFALPGAHRFSPDELAARQSEIPRDRDIVLYCTCPSEATAAKTAMMLQNLGIDCVRPLRGGFEEWKRLGYPLEPIPPAIPFALSTQSTHRNNKMGSTQTIRRTSYGTDGEPQHPAQSASHQSRPN
jgi:membrane protein DedA with SNARE-associated domain/rhodanese-related sulfurtransferase